MLLTHNPPRHLIVKNLKSQVKDKNKEEVVVNHIKLSITYFRI